MYRGSLAAGCIPSNREHIRKKLLEEMEADTREEILERISQICE